MIITDTTNANTGKRNGVVVKLQQTLQQQGSMKNKWTSLWFTFRTFLIWAMPDGTQEPFSPFWRLFLYLKRDRIWRRFTDSFHMSGQNIGLVVRSTMTMTSGINLMYWSLTKALQSFKNHWKKEPSVIDIPRSNQIADVQSRWCKTCMLPAERKTNCNFDSF